jgi:hypothetical protein
MFMGRCASRLQLYWSLINVYRLPEVMFELTRKQQ